MEDDEMIEVIEGTIERFCRTFEQEPYRYYTESDLACDLFSCLQKALSYATIEDLDKMSHYLVHSEYPTPFKCDMANKRFKVMGDSSRYKRGHFDIVVLAPSFIARNRYPIIKAQAFRAFRDAVGDAPKAPPMLYGLELVFRRDELKDLAGVQAEVRQDHDKLMAAMTRDRCFMSKARTLVFLLGTQEDRCDELRRMFNGEIDRGEVVILSPSSRSQDLC